MKKALKNIDLESTNRIIEMAWEDRTPFEVIEKEFSINHGELISIMRNNLKPSSFRLWRKRVNGRKTKHGAVKTLRLDVTDATDKAN